MTINRIIEAARLTRRVVLAIVENLWRLAKATLWSLAVGAAAGLVAWVVVPDSAPDVIVAAVTLALGAQWLAIGVDIVEGIQQGW